MALGLVDIYQPPTPTAGASSPVVVLFHGFEGRKEDLRQVAMQLANHGYVAFVAQWGVSVSADLLSPEGLEASDRQNACALAFAQLRASDFGGDPTRVLVFGHSAGAMTGATLAFDPAKPNEGCLATDLRPAAGFVGWEGDWLAEAGFWPDLFAQEPSLTDTVMPWAAIRHRPDLPVALLQGATSDMPDLPVADLSARDPSGALRAVLEKAGALKDGKITIGERQQLLADVLEAQGNPVTLDTMPGSTHESISAAGWPVLLAAFDRVAGR
jgi:acetyl esterase/lipase